jgi:hypothetical protein
MAPIPERHQAECGDGAVQHVGGNAQERRDRLADGRSSKYERGEDIQGEAAPRLGEPRRRLQALLGAHRKVRRPSVPAGMPGASSAPMVEISTHPRAMPQRARQVMRCDVPAAMGGCALKFQAVITAAWAIGCRSAARLGLPVNAAWRPIYVPPHPCDPGVRPGGRTCERRLSDPIGAADTAQKQPGVTAAGSSRRCLGTLHLSVSWHDLQWF